MDRYVTDVPMPTLHAASLAPAPVSISALIAEREVPKRLLIVNAAGLPENVEVQIVFVDLLFHFEAIRSAGGPRGRRNAALDAGRCNGGEKGTKRDAESVFAHDQNS